MVDYLCLARDMQIGKKLEIKILLFWLLYRLFGKCLVLLSS